MSVTGGHGKYLCSRYIMHHMLRNVVCWILCLHPGSPIKSRAGISHPTFQCGRCPSGMAWEVPKSFRGLGWCLYPYSAWEEALWAWQLKQRWGYRETWLWPSAQAFPGWVTLARYLAILNIVCFLISKLRMILLSNLEVCCENQHCSGWKST